jgi:DNA-binding IclR family transcriptional regulator
VRWAAIRESTTSLKTLAQPILSELAQATGETAHLSLLENKRLETLIYCESSAHSARVVMSDADYLPLHATASGHAVLSASSEEFVDEILASELPNYTGATLTSPASVRTKIITDRRAMISKTMGTFDGDVAGTAAPIFGPAEEVIGAIAIAGLASRITADLDYKICQVLPQAARDISRQCGGRIPKIVEQAWHHG